MQLIERRFMFHGSVVGFAGHIRRPQDSVLMVKGSAALPATGGYAHLELSGEFVPKQYSFSSISTTVSGDYTDLNAARERSLKNPNMDAPLSAITRAQCRVEHLTIAEHLTIDKVELNLSSTHGGSPPPVFSSRGSVISGLRLDGYLLNVNLDNDLFSGPLGTRQALCSRYERDESIRNHFISNQGIGANDVVRRPTEVHGHIPCTLIRSIDWATEPHPKAQITAPHIVHLDDYGYIYLGEMFITDDYRQVTLVRVQLGSASGGETTCCEGRVNGHDM